MCTGATLGLVGTILGFSLFVFLSGISFGLVFLFGVYVTRKRPEGPILAAATLWFATIGGLPFLWIFGLSFWFGWLALLIGSLLILGTAIAIAGAALKLTEWQRGPARRPPPGLFKRAAWLLGAGSFVLLIAAATNYPGLSSPGYGELTLCTVLVVVGLWLHLVAWITLFAATTDGFGDGAESPRLNWGRLAWTVSAISFVVAVNVAPYLHPFNQGWYPLQSLLFPFLFPYHPALFAPVVLCHAFIFRGYSRTLLEGRPQKTVWIGVLALVASAIVGLGGLLAYYAPIDVTPGLYWWILLPFPSGSTAVGYWLVFYGWRRPRNLEQATNAPLGMMS